MKRNISILGSTGSIGKQALEVVSAFPSYFNVVGLSAKNDIKELLLQINTFKPSIVSVATEETLAKLKALLPGDSIKLVCGDEGLKEVASYVGANMTLI